MEKIKIMIDIFIAGYVSLAGIVFAVAAINEIKNWFGK